MGCSKKQRLYPYSELSTSAIPYRYQCLHTWKFFTNSFINLPLYDPDKTVYIHDDEDLAHLGVAMAGNGRKVSTVHFKWLRPHPIWSYKYLQLTHSFKAEKVSGQAAHWWDVSS